MSNAIDQIKKQINIVDIVSEYIDLSKKGRNFWALCPFHEDSNPSMSVSPDKQMFKCFVCGTGGDAIKFVSDYEKISFQEALFKLGEKVGVKVDYKKDTGPKYSEKEKEMFDIMEETMNFFQYSLITEEGSKALEYAESRKLNTKIREDFLIGYAPRQGLKEFLVKKGYDVALLMNIGLVNQREGDFFKDRLIFGLTNEYGKVVGFSARDLSGNSQAKYINSPETKLFSKSNTLYNLANAKEVIKKEKLVFINEGFMDVIAMNRAGFRNSVAIMGTALTKEHIRHLQGKTVVLMLDSDKAGISATIKSIKILIEFGITTKVVTNEQAKDPDELLEINGVEGLREIANKQIDALEFIFKMHQDKFKEKTPSTIHEFIKSFAKYLGSSDDMTKDFYINKLVKELGISREIILKEIPFKNNNQFKPKKQFVKKEFKAPLKKAPVKKEIFKKVNRQHELLSFMNKNPSFIEKWKQNKRDVILDPFHSAVLKYLMDPKKHISYTKEESFMKVYTEIIEYKLEDFSHLKRPDDPKVDPEDVFENLINLVNESSQKKTNQKLNEKFSVKLKNKSNQEDSGKILQEQANQKAEQMRKNKGDKK